LRIFTDSGKQCNGQFILPQKRLREIINRVLNAIFGLGIKNHPNWANLSITVL
jgi:hypothetical protein